MMLHVVWSRHTSQGLIEGVFSWTSAWCMMLWVGHQEFCCLEQNSEKQTWWHKRTKGHSETRICQFSVAQKFPTHIHPIIISQVFKFWVFDVESVQNYHPIIPVIPVHLLAPFESPAVDCFHPLRGYGSSDLDRCWSGKNVIIRLSYGETKHKKTRFCCLVRVILRGPESFWRDQDTTRWMVFFCRCCVRFVWQVAGLNVSQKSHWAEIVCWYWFRGRGVQLRLSRGWFFLFSGGRAM